MDGTVSLRGRSQDATTLIEVEDSRPGIQDELLARIFDPILSTRPRRMRPWGLPIVKEIVESHNGMITVSSSNRVSAQDGSCAWAGCF
jgi:nitrogen-specific signal transduction histidine kinase